jgi:hypothetical protein
MLRKPLEINGIDLNASYWHFSAVFINQIMIRGIQSLHPAFMFGDMVNESARINGDLCTFSSKDNKWMTVRTWRERNSSIASVWLIMMFGKPQPVTTN